MSYVDKRFKLVVEPPVDHDGMKIGVIRPDEDGYYAVCVSVIGRKSRNNTFYDVKDYIYQLTSSDTYINKMVTEGTLFSEYGHPYLIGLSNVQVLQRLLYMDEKQVCGHIKKLWTGDPNPDGSIPLYALVRPHGPYGKYLQESLETPGINTSFSLRALADETKRPDGTLYRNLKKLVTFDFVAAGGYAEASKRFSPSVEAFEGLSFDFIPSELQMTPAALENFSQCELIDIFGTGDIKLLGEMYNYVKGQRSVTDLNGKKTSVAGLYLKGK